MKSSKCLFLLLVCIELTSSAYAQQDATSLQKEWDQIQSSYLDAPSATIQLIDSVQSLPDIQADSSLWYEAEFYRGLCLRYLGSFAESLSVQQKNYQYFRRQNDPLLQAKIADQLGIMNNFMGNMNTAQDYLLEAHDIYKEHGSPAQIASSNNGLGIFYSGMDQVDKAIQRYELSLKQYEAIDDTLGRANVHANLGLLFIDENEYDEAEYHILMQGKLDTLLGTQWGLGFHYDFLGLLRQKQGRYDEALEAHQKSLDLRETLESEYNIAESRSSLANIYNTLGQYDQAINQAQQIVESESRHQSLTQMMNAYGSLAAAYEGKKEWRKALEYHQKYKIYSDSIYSRDMLDEITQKDAVFQRAEQDHKIELLTQKNLASEALLRQKNVTIIIGALALVLISLLSFFLYRLYQNVKKQRSQLSKTIAEKDILLKEIHHRVKNNLQVVSSLLSIQSRDLESPSAVAALNEGKNRVHSMALIHENLYSGQDITTIEMKKYLEQLCQNIFYAHNIDSDKVRLILDIEDLALDISIVVPLGLIYNELITNACKYAFTDKPMGVIRVSLKDNDGKLIASVSDNGVGVNSEQKQENFGSNLVRILADDLDAELTFENKQGLSTELRILNYKKQANAV